MLGWVAVAVMKYSFQTLCREGQFFSAFGWSELVDEVLGCRRRSASHRLKSAIRRRRRGRAVRLRVLGWKEAITVEFGGDGDLVDGGSPSRR